MTICPSDAASPTVGRLLSSGAAYLLRHGIDAREAQSLSEILLSEMLELSGPTLLLAREKVLTEAHVETLRAQFMRVAAGEPVQYVVGHWPFHRIELKTDARALIPRPETEALVERILVSPSWQRAHSVADIGTGTGAIILALAAAARAQGRERTFTAVDLSPEALCLARENAEALGLADRVRFVEGDGCAVLEPSSVDIIVSNPPYIASADVDALPLLIRAHEPRLALDGGEDGLDTLRQIILEATQALRPKGALFLEIGEDQGLAVRRLLDRSGYTQVAVAQDLAGHDRYVEGHLL